MPWYLPLACVGGAALLSALVTAWVRRRAPRWGFVDRPGGHKSHAREVALGGGIAIVSGVVLPMLAVLIAARLALHFSGLALPEFVRTHLDGIVAKSAEGTALIAGAIILHILGLIDDLRPLPAALRLMTEIAVAAALAVGFDLRILSHLGPAASTAVTVVWIVTITNAFNFLDNMDGLAAGVGVIVAAVYSVIAAITGQVFVPACCWLLAGALLGFLPFNFHPASIYLGDAGSTVVGFLIAVFTVLTTFYNPAHDDRPIGVIAPLLVLAVPLYDTISVLYLRWSAGRPIWTGDRAHWSHRLVRAGMSARRAVLFIWIATFATALPALLLPQASWPLAVGILVHTLAVVSLVALLESAHGSRP